MGIIGSIWRLAHAQLQLRSRDSFPLQPAGRSGRCPCPPRLSPLFLALQRHRNYLYTSTSSGSVLSADSDAASVRTRESTGTSMPAITGEGVVLVSIIGDMLGIIKVFHENGITE